MCENTSFREVIPDNEIQSPKKLIFCSGQVYYSLLRTREANNIKDVSICRVEQLSPFPFTEVIEEMKKHPDAEVVWAQEEPLNMGFWTFVQPRIQTSLEHLGRSIKVKYAGREPTGSVATGNKKKHATEESDLLSMALLGEIKRPSKFVSGFPVW
jgi:2-oxoglutarate dehydrogenase E1 component